MEMKTLYRVQLFIAFMGWEKRGKRWGERGVPQLSANSIWSELARKEQGWGPSTGDADTSMGPTPLGRPPTPLLACLAGCAHPLQSRLWWVLVEGLEDKEDGFVGHQDEVEYGVHITEMLQFNLEALQNLRKRGCGLRREAGRVCLPQARLIHL